MLWRWHKTFYVLGLIATFLMFSYFFMIQDNSYQPTNRANGKNDHKGLFVEKIVAYAEDFFNQVSNYPCHNLTLNDVDKVDLVNGMWQKPRGSEVYAFTAYYDNRYKSSSGKEYHFVRVIASNLGNVENPVYCQLWYANRTNPLVVQADASEIWSKIWDRNSKNLYYKPYLISCPIPSTFSDTGTYPAAVTVTLEPCVYSGTFLELAKPLPRDAKKKSFAVCVKGMDFAEDISVKFVEWVETQLIMGASSITFYLFQVHPNVQKALNYYQSLGKVILRNLTLPGRQPNSPPSSRSEFLKKNQWQKRRHELVPYNDCFYSYIYSHRLVALVDLDEVIVPTTYPSWEKLFAVIVNNQADVLAKYASFSVQNVYFFDDFGPTYDPDVPQYHHILRYIHRSSNFSKPGYAVKSFLSTSTTLMAFNHYALNTLYPDVRRSALVSADMARLHHYRKGCPNGMKNDCDNIFMKYVKKDTTVFRWKEKIRDQTKATLQNIGLLGLSIT